MYRNKFCVGEEVCVRGVTTNKFDIDRVEVVQAKYHRIGDLITPNYRCTIEGWKYKTAHLISDEPHKWFLENSLHKLPPKNDPWADCFFNPSKDEPEEQKQLTEAEKLERLK